MQCTVTVVCMTRGKRRPIESGIIACPKCAQEKPVGDFYKRSSGKIEAWCKLCLRERDAKRREDPEFREHKRKVTKEWAKNNPRRVQARNLQKFNLGEDPVAAYEEMVLAQLGMCAICGGPPGRRSLSVDHDHSCCDGNFSCGKCVRGLLCANCNHLLGKAKDDPVVLQRAIDYLEKW